MSPLRAGVPLVVDLDGTLLRSDLLFETALLFLGRRPWRLLSVLFWLVRGKAHLKQALAERTVVDVAALPWNPAVLDLIAAARAEQRPVWLATASDARLAAQVASHLGCFEGWLASDGHCNLSGPRKEAALVKRFGHAGFDYAGNSHDDLSVWAAARGAVLVDVPSSLRSGRRRPVNTMAELGGRPAPLPALIRALRPHQWLKNALVLVPLLAAHRMLEPVLVLQALGAFALFSLCASSVYVLNDLIDLTDDRHHPRKRQRPFAAGTLSLMLGSLLWPSLLVASASLALTLLPARFALVLGAYYLLTLGYSVRFKQVMAVDVILLAILYTLRIVAGAAATGIALTFWMLAFSMFIFLSLALVKRYAELREVRVRGAEARARGRGYFPADLEMIASLGAASAYMAVLVLALYINDLGRLGLYRHPQLVWLACPLLLLWLTRVWLLTHRGEMHDDPVVFAVTDRVSLCIGVLFGLVFVVAA